MKQTNLFFIFCLLFEPKEAVTVLWVFVSRWMDSQWCHTVFLSSQTFWPVWYFPLKMFSYTTNPYFLHFQHNESSFLQKWMKWKKIKKHNKLEWKAKKTQNEKKWIWSLLLHLSAIIESTRQTQYQGAGNGENKKKTARKKRIGKKIIEFQTEPS